MTVRIITQYVKLSLEAKDYKNLELIIIRDLKTASNFVTAPNKDFSVLRGIRKSFQYLNEEIFRV